MRIKYTHISQVVRELKEVRRIYNNEVKKWLETVFPWFFIEPVPISYSCLATYVQAVHKSEDAGA